MGPPSAIAVVGLGCRYPGVRSPRELWENVLARRRQFRRFPDCRLPLGEYFDPAPRAPDKTYATRGAFIDGFEFDWAARRVPEKTFVSTDVVHWLALEVALQALEDAGYSPDTVPGERAAVLVGNSMNGEQTRANYLRLRWPYVRRVLRASLPGGTSPELEEAVEEVYKSVFPPVNEDTLAGVLSNTIAGRICNFLDLHGGGFTVDGACASGMLAVAQAASALTAGDVDLALAGGVDVSLDAMELIGFAKVGALTRDDMTVYDKRGSGFIPGEGCGFVVLKRLADAEAAGDRVYAVIRGWGISTDGRGALTAPSADAQALMLRRAYERAGWSPHELRFVEGHGTATAAGDKAELKGLQLALDAFGEPGARSVGMTSFKSLVGHTKAASGIAGLIKAVIAVNRRVVPPFAGFREPNAAFARFAPALYPVVRGEVLDPAEPLRAGASAMGFGGINCHVALEAAAPPDPALAPAGEERALMASGQESELFLLAAATALELAGRAEALAAEAEGMSVAELTDLAAELAGEAAAGAGPLRAAVVADRPDELAERLRALARVLAEEPPGEGAVLRPGGGIWVGNAVERCRVGFLFPGQGSQQLGMARRLVERHGWARDLVRAADERLVELGLEPVWALADRPVERAADRAELGAWSAELARTETAQPAICVAALLWLEELRRLGLEPAVVAGHSLGELVAFHAAGAFDRDGLVGLAGVRGRAMAAPAEEAGAMAALGCGREAAEALVARAGGYAAVANVNSPEQTVVSGERAAVDEIVRLAEEDGLRAVELRVSNAFHSRLVEPAAAELCAHAPVPETLGETGAVLVSGLDGEPVSPGLDLREHVAAQVLAPVDFVAVARRLAAECDVLLEVGPGRVLSDLVAATTGPDGPPCFPVESEPGRDRDLNAALGALFAHGADLAWPLLYESRLVRPFTPPSQLRFIESPLERPLAVPAGGPAPAAGEGGALERLLAETAGLSGAALADYVARRGRFLAEVVRADLGTSPPPARAPEPAPPAPAPEPASLEARLVALAAAKTGFPAETIGLDSRLLDDLNLDSIKAAELVVEAAGGAGVEGLDTGVLANASLREVADALRGTDAAPGGGGAAAVLADVVVAHTGFPPETIVPELRLLDDLNLDSIKAAEVVLEAAGRLGVPAETLDPSQFANATLAEIAAAFAGGARPAAPGPDPLAGRASWVRSFAVEETLEELDAHPPLDLAGAFALVLCEDGDAAAPAIAAALAGLGADVRTGSFAEPGAGAGVVVALLPGDGGAAVERLRTPAVEVEWETLVYVRSEDGPAAAAFAASVHHERPERSVRVVSFAPETEPVALAERVAAELAAPGPFAAASYDGGLVRRVVRPRVLDPAVLPRRALGWTAESAVLVTGGAKGITAECALALARATGARLALAGRAPASDPEVAAALERLAAAGVTAAYFPCDVTDEDAVRALVVRVRAEVGPIAGVLHGAGANVARRVEQATADEARAEVAPKLEGALNLLRVLADDPPALVAALTSATGVTGMPGNAWYAYANEELDRVLGRFAAEHPRTVALAVAFSVWSDVGMGARSGSAEHLARMGVAPIPPEEAAPRFLELVERDPGARQAVVAARLRGLDTWRPEPHRLPPASRFLEPLVHVEPGVEVVARPRLSLAEDAYLADHVYAGSHLFPTVFGLEAMAQAVAFATGETDLATVAIEDARLARAVVVDPERGAEIEVRVEVLERAGPDEPRRVRAAIGAAATGFAESHFSATFVLGPAAAPPAPEDAGAPGEPLDLRPEDIYGPLLFQGPSFQRLDTVAALDSTRIVFGATETDQPYLLGDPFLRDALLQAAQLVVPQSVCLPVEIARIERFGAGGALPAPRTGVVVNLGRTDGHENARAVLLDEGGAVVERLDGFRSKIVERREENPTAEELADPARRDAALLRRELERRAAAAGVAVPELAFAYLPGLHELDVEERRRRELGLFEEAVGRALGGEP